MSSSSFFYKLLIQYRGTSFGGWQVQDSKTRTIQGEINSAFFKMTKLENFKTIGSGRTDAGVHALGQVIRLETNAQIPKEGLLKGLNDLLPSEIRVMKVEMTTNSFHPIFSAKMKEYNYLFSKNELSPFISDLCTQYRGGLNLDLLVSGLELLKGEHDFVNYFCVGTEVKTTKRTIFECELTHVNDQKFWDISMPESIFCIKIVGSGFLKQMVRLLVGGLWAVAAEKVSLREFEDSLKIQSPQKLAPPAPPQGLYLKSVTY